MSDEEKAREFRLEVKKRLFGPYRVGVFTVFELEFLLIVRGFKHLPNLHSDTVCYENCPCAA